MRACRAEAANAVSVRRRRATTSRGFGGGWRPTWTCRVGSEVASDWNDMKTIQRLFVVACFICATGLAAQTPSTADRVAALKQSLADNQAALKQYNWIETTTISLK